MYRYKFFSFILVVLFLISCKDNEIDTPTAGVEVGIPVVSDISYNSAKVSSKILSGNTNVVRAGVCYGKVNNPSISDLVEESVITNGNISITLNGLEENTIYYIRAFVTMFNAEPVYSEVVSFTTPSSTINDELANYQPPQYVDNYTSVASWEKRHEWNLSNVHDPTVVKADDGYFYMYQTDASYGNAHDGHGHFHCRRSNDLVNWEYLGAIMQEAPSWVKEKLNAYRKEMGLEPINTPSYGFWAPVVRKVKDGLYRLYYSIVVDNYIKSGAFNTTENFDNSWTERAFIGLMETSDPSTNIWEDKGMVVCSSSDKGYDGWNRISLGDWNSYFKFNAIDPTYVISEDGKHWLIYGSWHSGIAAMELDPESGLSISALSEPWNISEWNTNSFGKLIATRGNENDRWQGSEGPEVIYHDGYYYMFMAYGQLSVAYNTRVVRSLNPDGPYVDMNGADAASGGDMYPAVTAPYKFNSSYGWVGISHCCVFEDGNGNWFYSSQGRFPVGVPGINVSNAIMMGHIRSIRWTEDGWPVVMPERYGAVPQVKIEKDELVGNWELIQLRSTPENSFLDSNAQQFTSQNVVLLPDGSVESSSWGDNVKWLFDDVNNILEIGGYKIYIQREVDWEMTPRAVTIVGAGYQDNGKITNWMKKIY